MDAELIEILTKYRLVVGYLGEKEQFGWWQSSFFTRGSQAFLAPLFARTQILAQCNGVTRAAALAHDERIGIGHVYHLFRLPEEIEQDIARSLHAPTLAQAVPPLVAKPEAALDYLRASAAGRPTKAGPIRIANVEALHDRKAWQTAAGAYRFAFEQGILVYPYFSDAL